MIHHLLAAVGLIAHVLARTVGAILSLVGLSAIARFVAPVLVALLALGAVLSGVETARILGTRPDVQESTLAEVAEDDGEGNVFFRFDALIDDVSLETSADLGTHFYLARDPEGSDRGLLVRSPLDDDRFRERAVTGTLVADSAFVEEAIERIGDIPPNIDVATGHYLDETGPGVLEEAIEPSDLDGVEPGTEGTVVGRILSPATSSACAVDGGCDGDDATWLYLLADANGAEAVVLRSPHPPDAIPVRLQGLFLRDAFDLAPVLASDWFAAIDADVPTDSAFRADTEPPVTVPASWTPTIVFAVLALVLLASVLVGYPVFAAGQPAEPRLSLASGEEVPVLITGRLATRRARVTADRSPGTVERMPIADVAMLLWRYGELADTSRRDAEERFTREAGGGDRLVVVEPDQSAIVLVGEEPARAIAGTLYRVMRRTPAVRLRQGRTDAYLATRSAAERDRLAAEIAAEPGPRPPAVLGSAAST